ncbi:flagellar assembly protein FliH [Terrarubrum flagellatum]|uniref:flagellar assembly protein FliH n=1 Tax=Terrirubrum flagellatum TaxID=2895980 RepID=UPI0031454F83
MTAAEKFIFGHDFGKAPKAPLAPSANERARVDNEERAREKGFAQGVAEGRAQAQREFDQRLMKALESIATRAAELLASADELETAAASEVVTFALRFAEAAAGVAITHYPLAALEAAARDVFGQLRQAPHCVIRLHESLVEQANEALARIARERGFEGRLIVMGETDIARADFSLEWADGGMRRESAALRQKLVDAIERHAAIAVD